jgi:DNA-binding transcriptional MocR family regulator
MERYNPTGDSVDSISADIEAAVRDGRLASGNRLPPVRDLAALLGVSPTTVAAVYRNLGGRGVLRGDGRRGTTVAPRPPVMAAADPVVPDGVRDLATGNPDPDLLPDLRALLPRIDWPSRLYNQPADHAALVARCHERFAADGLPPGDLAICGGALDALELVLGAHLRIGDRLALEDPGHGPIQGLVTAMGLHPQPIAVDEHGMLPDPLWAALARGARAVVLTPRAQNPTGAALDAERAETLASILARYPDVVVVEDDHAGPVAGATLRSTCRGARHWAVIQSFSKWLGPDLRTAAVLGDPVTVARLSGRQILGTGWVSYLLQATVAAALADAEVGSAVRRAEAAYAQRRRALVDALAARGLAAWGRSGLNVWVPILSPASNTEERAVAALADVGWAVAPGRRFAIGRHPALRVTIATLQAGEAATLAAHVAGALQPSPRRRTHTA